MLVPFALAQPPAIFQDGVVNSASHLPGALEGGSVARGSLITIRGVRLTGGSSSAQVRIETGGAWRELKVISASPEQIEAQIPTDAPTGKAQLAVSNQSGASTPYALTVVQASFGVFSTNAKGFGPGRIWNLNENAERVPNSAKEPAMPGQTIVLEGTGLGEVREPEIFVGARRITKLLSVSRSRNRIGIDILKFILPNDVPEGCFVPLFIRLPSGYSSQHAQVSNVVTMSIHSNGHECVPPSDFPSRLYEAANLGLFFLARTAIRVEGISASEHVDFTSDHGIAGFIREQPTEDVATPFHLIPPSGSCTAYTGHVNPGTLESGLFAAIGRDPTAWLKAGPQIQVRGPRGARALLPYPNQPGLFRGTLGGKTPRALQVLPSFLEPGHFVITVPGSTDVGRFELALDAPPDLKWTNSADNRTIDRSRGFTVKWRSRQGQRILIAAMGVDQLSTAAGFCLCLPSAHTGRFFVPPAVLANIPGSKSIPGLPMDYLFVVAWNGENIAALPPGLNQVFGASILLRGQSVIFR